MKKSRQNKAKLRVCARCEWIYQGLTPCPKCEFASYGARWVFGDKCYKYLINQKPWLERKMSQYHSELINEIREASKKTAQKNSN